ncbi:hypothetical protein [Streptomyces sp. NPDC055400]
MAAISDPVVRVVVAAINAGAHSGFLALPAPDAAMPDDGTDRDLHHWFARARGHHEETARRELHGMGGWFATTPAGATAKGAAPQRWKMAVTSAFAIAPLTVASTLLISPT